MAVTTWFGTWACAEDWPQWRGMNRDGVWREAGIPESFPEGGLKVRWRATVGPGWSSPAIAAGRVYVADVELKKPRAWERALCFDEKSGELLWTHSYEAPYPAGCFTPGQENGPGSTPLIQGGKVFTLGETGEAYCLDAVSGSVIWHRTLSQDYQTKPFTTKASPLPPQLPFHPGCSTMQSMKAE